MDKEINLAQICRVCLLKDEDLCDMSSTMVENITLLAALNYTFGQKCLQDKFPKCICKQCAVDAENAYSFKLKFEKSYECISTLIVADPVHLKDQTVVIEEDEIIDTFELQPMKPPSEIFSETTLSCDSPPNYKGESPESSQLTDVLDIKCEIKEEPIDDGGVVWSSFVDENYFELSNLDEASGDFFEDADDAIDSESQFMCGLCGLHLDSKDNLQAHMQIHKGGVMDVSYKCSTCAATFVDESELHAHLTTHRGKKLYECTICHKVFQRKWNLLKHQVVHDNERPYKCGNCKRGFSTTCTLLDHEAQCATNKLYACETCSQTFVHKFSLTQHQQVHVNAKPFKCKVCGKGFSQKWVLRNHEAIHNGSNPFVCNICEKAFITKQGLKRHHITHANVKPYKCDTCGATFTQKSSMRTHVDSIHIGIRHECDICNVTFSTKRTLKKHQITSHNLGPYLEDSFPKLICKQCVIDVEFVYSFRQKCEKSFESFTSSLLADSIASRDCSLSIDENTDDFEITSDWEPRCVGPLNEEQIMIELYSETISDCNNDQLEKPHALTISELEDFGEVKCEIKEEVVEDSADCFPEKNYFELSNLNAGSINFVDQVPSVLTEETTLNDCEQSFESTKNLGEHTETHFETKYKKHETTHIGKKPYVCEICNKTFMRKWNFKQHQHTQTIDRSHKCSICGRHFVTRCALLEHEASHTKIRPHFCEVCNKAFTTRQVLRRHQSTHTNEKRFSCDTCGKLFTQKCSLQSHQAIHTGIKPHQCDVCDKAFIRKWNLMQHLATHKEGWAEGKVKVLTTSTEFS